MSVSGIERTFTAAPTAGIPTALVPQAPAPAERAPAWRRPVIPVAGYIAADIAAVAAAYALAGPQTAAGWLTLLAWPLALATVGLYGPGASSPDRFRRLVTAVALGGVAAAAFYRLQGRSVDHQAAIEMAALSLAAIWTERRLTRRALLTLAQTLGQQQRVIVVGTNHEARTLARSIARGSRPGSCLAGLVGPVPSQDCGELPILGGYEDLEWILEHADASAAVVASSALEAGALAEVSARLQAAGVETSISVGLPAVAATRVSVDSIDGVAVLQVRPHRLSSWQRFLKRAVDLVGASVLLALSAPVTAVLALVVRITSGPGIIYSQLRVGEGGHPFRIYKLRTMIPDADKMVVDLEAANNADGVLFKIFDDPRVTPVGRFLRRYGLDELPQLWNVVRGEMSLVGPRPPLPHETERYDEWVRGRLTVKPGLTGLWQIKGRHQLGWDDYVHFDLFYVENWSLSMDLSIIVRTVPALLAHRGAF